MPSSSACPFWFKIAGIRVDTVFGINPVTMVLGEPLHAVGFAAFFIRGERHDEVARGNPAFFFEADEIRDQDGIALLVVRRAATIKEAIHLIELEWVHGPVLAQRFHHIKVSKKQDGLSRAASVKADDDVFLVGQWPIDMDIFRREAGSPKARGHGFRRGRNVPGRRISGVDFNELLKNIAGGLMFR